jgi:hypothetical protein
MKARLPFLAAVLSLACGREPDVSDLAAAPGPGAIVALRPLALTSPAAFDRLDDAVADPADRLRIYNDLARLAPDARPVLYRGALAALDAGSDKGVPVADGVLRRLRETGADDPDLEYLDLRLERARIAGPDGLPRVDAGSLEAARRVVERAATFAAARTAWAGPRRTSARDVERLGREVADAVARFEQGVKPAADEEDGTEPEE